MMETSKSVSTNRHGISLSLIIFSVENTIIQNGTVIKNTIFKYYHKKCNLYFHIFVTLKTLVFILFDQ